MAEDKPKQSSELLRIENEREVLLAEKPPYLVTTDVELTVAMTFIEKARVFKQGAEKVRSFFVKPLNDHVRDINADFKALVQPITETEERLVAGVQYYRAQLAQTAAIEQARLNAEAAQELNEGKSLIPEAIAATAKAPEKKIVTETGSMHFTEHWTFEVEDITKLPKEYLLPDTAKIGKVVKALKGDTNIPGIKLIREEIPVRGR